MLPQNILFLIFIQTLFATVSFSSEVPEPRILPPFKKFSHGVSSGSIAILDTKRILIKNLRYDGAGPDAFFWVGAGTEPNKDGVKIQNELGSSDVLSGYQGEDVELTLPGALTFNDIDYLSIWCVAFQENFGHVLIPKDLNVPEYISK